MRCVHHYCHIVYLWFRRGKYLIYLSIPTVLQPRWQGQLKWSRSGQSGVLSWCRLAMQSSGISEGSVSGVTEAGSTWQTLLPGSRNTVNIGAIITASGAAPAGPTQLSINGVACALTG